MKEGLLEEIDKYIDKYYIPENDDIRMDKEIKSIFQKITELRLRKFAEKQANEKETPEESLHIVDENELAELDVDSMQKIKVYDSMSGSIPANRKIDDLMNQMGETFSQRLLRMIAERGMTDSEAYTKAYVDRRHFSKIRKDDYYSPNKKTVLAFAIALELSLDETKDLLMCAGFALSRSSKVDIIVAYFLQNKIYDMFEINEVLYEYGQPIFE